MTEVGLRGELVLAGSFVVFGSTGCRLYMYMSSSYMDGLALDVCLAVLLAAAPGDSPGDAPGLSLSCIRGTNHAAAFFAPHAYVSDALVSQLGIPGITRFWPGSPCA